MIYVDTSAFLKSVLDEPQSAAMQSFLEDAGRPGLVSSRLLAVEARRGTLRARPARLPRVDVTLAGVTLLDVSDAVIENAGRLPDPLLRTLDAIHLATALLIRADVDVLLTYDDRMASAARSHGIEVAAPA